MSLDEALACPRIHSQESGKVTLERSPLTDLLQERLVRSSHKVVLKAPLSYSMGSVQAIQFCDNGRLVAAADPRRDGAAAVVEGPPRKVER